MCILTILIKQQNRFLRSSLNQSMSVIMSAEGLNIEKSITLISIRTKTKHLWTISHLLVYSCLQMIQKTMVQENYQEIDFLGKGSYGRVLKVRNKTTNEQFALKQVDLSKMYEKQQYGAICQIELLCKLTSPYIIKCYDFFLRNKLLSIVLQYCKQGDLQSYLKSHYPLPQKTIWKVAYEILSGLNHMHSNNIMHRDIKLANIFLDASGTAKIGDLGISRCFTNFAETIIGTPYYMAPEIYKGEKYSSLADVWSFGCLLYQLCTNRRPFEAKNSNELKNKIKRGAYDQIALNKVSLELRMLIKNCLVVSSKLRLTTREIIKNYQKQFKIFNNTDKVEIQAKKRINGSQQQKKVNTPRKNLFVRENNELKVKKKGKSNIQQKINNSVQNYQKKQNKKQIKKQKSNYKQNNSNQKRVKKQNQIYSNKNIYEKEKYVNKRKQIQNTLQINYQKQKQYPKQKQIQNKNDTNEKKAITAQKNQFLYVPKKWNKIQKQKLPYTPKKWNKQWQNRSTSVRDNFNKLQQCQKPQAKEIYGLIQNVTQYQCKPDIKEEFNLTDINYKANNKQRQAYLSNKQPIPMCQSKMDKVIKIQILSDDEESNILVCEDIVRDKQQTTYEQKPIKDEKIKEVNLNNKQQTKNNKDIKNSKQIRNNKVNQHQELIQKNKQRIEQINALIARKQNQILMKMSRQNFQIVRQIMDQKTQNEKMKEIVQNIHRQQNNVNFYKLFAYERQKKRCLANIQNNQLILQQLKE